MSALDDIVDRAIEYTRRTIQTMPSYQDTAVAGLRKLRAGLAEKAPGEPALKRLDVYLNSLSGRDACTDE